MDADFGEKENYFFFDYFCDNTYFSKSEGLSRWERDIFWESFHLFMSFFLSIKTYG